jgi:hypothetical protein
MEKFVEIRFVAEISGDLMRGNADLHRLYELLHATLEVHAHHNFFLKRASFENKAAWDESYD